MEQSITLSKNNMFYNDKQTIEQIKFHLDSFGNTCIGYEYVERFGVEKIKHDLQELGYECDIKVDTTDTPDSIYDWEYDNNRRIRMVYPILPSVIIFWKDYLKLRNKKQKEIN